MDCMEVFKRLVGSNISKIIELFTSSINVSNVLNDIESNLAERTKHLAEQEHNLENMNSIKDTVNILLQDIETEFAQLHSNISDIEQKLKN
jgi:predicted  nucleic acid-binding Zn-ribbon protein